MTGPERRGALVVLAGLLAFTAARQVWPRDPGSPRIRSGGTWIETAGEVDRPALRRYEGRVSIARALGDAGARCTPRRSEGLDGGRRIFVRARAGCRVRVSTLPAAVRLVLGLPLDPNADGADDLARLPGIGAKLAEGIVRARPYRTVDDLDRVKGIGPKTLARLRPYLGIAARDPRATSRGAPP